MEFTFQYVSINTIVQQSESNTTPLFTFQYVSINTGSLDEVFGYQEAIYIPICFY